MENLINKWFLGLDRPTAGGTYRQFAGQLFVSGATYTDIKQGYLGDCYFMASLAEIGAQESVGHHEHVHRQRRRHVHREVLQRPAVHYVTVDSYLPTDGAADSSMPASGMMYNNTGNELWTALAEKAYAQINEMGWIRTGLSGNGQNAYAAIEGGYIYAALGHITGQATAAFTSTAASNGFYDIRHAYNQASRSALPRRSRQRRAPSSAATPTRSSATTPRTKPSRSSIRGALSTAWSR